MNLKFSFPILMLVIASSLAGAQQTDAKDQAAINSIVQSHIVWESKITSPGATIVARQTDTDGNHVKYRLYVRGLPTDRLYTVLIWPVTQK